MRLWSRSTCRAAVTLAALLTGAAVRADIDVEIRSGDSLRGTFSPAGEVETLRFALPRGAKLTVRAAGVKKGPAASIALADPAETLRGTPVEKKLASKVVWVAGDSGTWSARISSRDGVTAGDYSVAAKWASPRKFGPTAATFGVSAERTFPFSADVGAKVRVVCAAARGSAALPRIVGVTGPGGPIEGLDDGAGGKTDRVGPFVAPATGDYVVRVVDTGGAGDIATTVLVTPPKPSKRRVDVRATVLGSGESEGAFARTAGPEGGEIVVPDTLVGLDEIAGSSITIPAGVLASSSTFVIGSAAAFDVPGIDETNLGPSVFFGPDGTTFGTPGDPKQVVLSIPVDLASVGGDRDAVEVWVRDSRGRTTKVPPPYDFDLKPGFVSFPTSHFSVYRAITAVAGPPQGLLTVLFPGPIADLAAPANFSGVANARVLLASGGNGTVDVVTRPVGATPESLVRYAGGGTQVTDGTDRLQFDFQDSVTAVFPGGNGEVFVGTPTRIFRITPGGAVTRIAGTGSTGDDGDSGPATAARFSSCREILADLAGNIFFVDDVNGRIRQVQSPNGTMLTVAGTGTLAFGADGDPIPLLTFSKPAGIAFRPGGGFLVCDQGRLRAVNPPQSTNVTVLGDPAGAVGSSGDGVGPTTARFRELDSVAVTPFGVIYVADRAAHTIRKYDPQTGLVTLVAGVHDASGTSPDLSPPPFSIAAPRGLVFEGGTLVFGESSGGIRSIPE